MCGIAGYTHLDSPLSPGRIAEALTVINHRGPDDQTFWEYPAVSLGVNRLRIIDLAEVSRGYVSDDKDFALAYNGEVYNHAELRRELIARGHRFHTSCDTEVVLHAFMEWDTGCIEKLRGMFVFAVWQQSRGRLVLARDRMGIKPVYYARKGRELYFGSELKSVLCHPEVSRQIDLNALDAYLATNYIPGPRSLVQDVRKLRPGSFLTWKDGEVSTHTYWQLDRADHTAPTSLEESTERLEQLISESVKEHLTADVPVGIWLSGGLDSSTILHYASQHSARKLKTYSITFNGREFDESTYIHQMAQRYQTEHQELDLSAAVVTPDSIADLAYYSDAPNADAGAVPVWYLSGMAAKQVTVALSGEGADELFGGYITYTADEYARRARMAPRTLRRMALRSAGMLRASNKKIGFDYKVQRFLQGTLMDDRNSHVFWNGTFSQAQRRELMRSEGSGYLAQLLATIPSHGDVRRFMTFDQSYYLPDNLLVKVDRMSMAHSLEVRPAFLDHRIVEFAAGLPARHCISGGNLKVVLRTLMRDKLPHSVITKQKQGLDIPVHDWLRGHLKPLLLDTLNQKTIEESGLLRWAQVDQIIRQHMQRKANYGYHLWGMLMLFLWIRQFKIQTGQDVYSREVFSAI